MSVHKNQLANESSPYLLQHADNPVNWYPWGKEALEKAKAENKPILLSIGYSSCHWCHVMAHESFENEGIAALMNDNFINIKLDREERPDIDHIYMDAVQNMGLRGGWPLNVFITPDQKPFYGGTYFPPENWTKLIQSIHEAYTTKYDKLYESAAKFAEDLQQSEALKYGIGRQTETLAKQGLDEGYDKLSNNFDIDWGGMSRAPKFPMPSVWDFLLCYGYTYDNEQAINHALFTLQKIQSGGIYDHVGGGFSRYSVDGYWHVPHFEKMLYDNGQLLCTIADAYKISHYTPFLTTLTETIGWLKREMQDTSGGFYSALDADSEGEEGKFYCWTFNEFKALAAEHFSLLAEYFDVSPKGNWEDGKNVLRRLQEDEELLEDLGISEVELNQIILQFKQKALKARDERIRPGLDSKIISGWNGLTLIGLCKSFQANPDSITENLARQNAAFLKNEMILNGVLLHTLGKQQQGFLDDYAAVMSGFIHFYETFSDFGFLQSAHEMAKLVLEEYFDSKELLLYYTSDQSEELIARKKELFDNVIPSSNSMMIENLYKLSLYFDNEDLNNYCKQTIQSVNPLLKKDLEFLSNWARVSVLVEKPTIEIIIVGPEYEQFRNELNRHYLPNRIMVAGQSLPALPIADQKKAIEEKTTIYICFDKVCQRPVFEIKDALKEIHKAK